MNHELLAACGLANRVVISRIAANEMNPVPMACKEPGEIRIGARAGQIVEDGDRLTFGEEGVGEVAPDEPGPARDKRTQRPTGRVLNAGYSGLPVLRVAGCSS
jgi:hypothetical protein